MLEAKKLKRQKEKEKEKEKEKAKALKEKEKEKEKAKALKEKEKAKALKEKEKAKALKQKAKFVKGGLIVSVDDFIDHVKCIYNSQPLYKYEMNIILELIPKLKDSIVTIIIASVHSATSNSDSNIIDAGINYFTNNENFRSILFEDASKPMEVSLYKSIDSYDNSHISVLERLCDEKIITTVDKTSLMRISVVQNVHFVLLLLLTMYKYLVTLPSNMKQECIYLSKDNNISIMNIALTRILKKIKENIKTIQDNNIEIKIDNKSLSRI
jgi:hypothetical protein